MKRRLSEEEKLRVRDRQTAIESARHPYHTVSVLVADETDGDGNPVWSVMKLSEDPGWGRTPFLMPSGCKW